MCFDSPASLTSDQIGSVHWTNLGSSFETLMATSPRPSLDWQRLEEVFWGLHYGEDEFKFYRLP
jgi:hypothetical protein